MAAVRARVAAAVACALVLVGATVGVALPARVAAAAPGPCRAVTLFVAAGRGPGSAALGAVTDPVVGPRGDRVGVVTVLPPDAAVPAAVRGATDALAARVAEEAGGCPRSRMVLLGWSEGAQVAGDLAARIGAGHQAGVPAARVAAVGLFGDPARAPAGRSVPAVVPGQGVLPARAGGFAELEPRTIEICAPEDPVCASPPGRAPPWAQAAAAPAHAGYARLAVAPGLTATRWAASSLSQVVDAAVASDAAPAPAPTPTPTPTPDSGTSVLTPAQSGPIGLDAPTRTTTPAPSGSRGGSGGVGSTAGMVLDSTVGDFASHFDNSGDSGLVDGGQKPRVVADPTDPSGQAFAFTVPGGAKRSEVLPRGAQNFHAGDHVFFGYVGSVDQGFPVGNADNFQVIMQLHDGGTNVSPPVALEIKKGQVWLTASGSGRSDQPLGPVSPGQPIRVQVEVQFQLHGGAVSAWRDGKQVLADYRPPQGTMIDDHDYLKVGLYRSGSIKQGGTVFLHELKIGRDLASVAPTVGRAGAPGPGLGSGAPPVASPTTTRVPRTIGADTSGSGSSGSGSSGSGSSGSGS